MKEERFPEKTERNIKSLEARLVKLEGLFSVSINKIACHEADLSVTGKSS